MTFDFSLLDDLLDVPKARLEEALQVEMNPGWVGPLMEYAFIRRQQGHSYLPAVSAIVPSDKSKAIEACESGHSGTLTSTTLMPQNYEIARLPDLIGENPCWLAFQWRLINAAKYAGFDDSSAKGFGGAYSELSNNAFEHSENRRSTLVAYGWRIGEFEMVIADTGIGVRESLKQYPDYANLPDDNTALESATTMGVSRHGPKSGRGTGFKTVFDSIAGFNGLLRFRTGTAAMVLDGRSAGAIRRKSLQRRYFKGMFAGIRCRLQ
jgi:hypothetical protein